MEVEKAVRYHVKGIDFRGKSFFIEAFPTKEAAIETAVETRSEWKRVIVVDMTEFNSRLDASAVGILWDSATLPPAA